MGKLTAYDPRHEWQFFEDFSGGGSFGAASAQIDYVHIWGRR